MKERPILFNDAMVRAILDGRKTQTRRVVKTHKAFIEWGAKGPDDAYDATTDDDGQGFFLVAGDHGYAGPVPCPFGQPGDRLWVRECFARLGNVGDGRAPEFIYRADSYRDDGFHPRWTPSIHMPREACRLALEIVGVRVDRLGDITEADAKAEGAPPLDATGYRGGFCNLWSSVYGAESLEANPWLWVVEFKVAKVGGGE